MVIAVCTSKGALERSFELLSLDDVVRARRPGRRPFSLPDNRGRNDEKTTGHIADEYVSEVLT